MLSSILRNSASKALQGSSAAFAPQANEPALGTSPQPPAELRRSALKRMFGMIFGGAGTGVESPGTNAPFGGGETREP